MGPIEALRLALSREKDSIKLYNKIYLEHKGLQETFLFLINEEEKHRQLIEKKIAELTRY
jgi:rubrerythrin